MVNPWSATAAELRRIEAKHGPASPITAAVRRIHADAEPSVDPAIADVVRRELRKVRNHDSAARSRRTAKAELLAATATAARLSVDNARLAAAVTALKDALAAKDAAWAEFVVSCPNALY